MEKHIGVLAEKPKSGFLFIYGLFDPRCGTLRYVGRTKMRLCNRLSAHVNYSKNKGRQSHKDNWIRLLLTEGLRPIIDILAEVPAHEAKVEEYAWIQDFLEKGQPLTNSIIAIKNDPIYPRMTPETRKRLSMSHKNRITEEERQHRSKIMKELWQDPEYQAKVSDGLRRAYKETDYREKVSKGGQGLKRSSETKAKISKARKLLFSNEEERSKLKQSLSSTETRIKMRDSAKRSWTPERRKAYSDRMKKKWQDPLYRESQPLLISEGRKRQGKQP
jgi:hypothetical protein